MILVNLGPIIVDITIENKKESGVLVVGWCLMLVVGWAHGSST